MSFVFKSPGRLLWKKAKNTHADTIKTYKIAFDEGLGPLLDKMDTLYEQLKKMGKITTEAQEAKAMPVLTAALAACEAFETKTKSYQEKIKPLKAAGAKDKKAEKAFLELGLGLSEAMMYGVLMAQQLHKAVTGHFHDGGF